MAHLSEAPGLRWKRFWGAALGINLTAFLAVHSLQKAPVAYGAAFDVAVTVPLLYFLLVVRAGLQPAITLVPLCLVAFLRATYLVPGLLWVRPALSASAELAVTALLVLRVRRAIRVPHEGDVLERLKSVAAEVVPVPVAAELLAAEIAVFYFAFLSWRTQPLVPDGSRAFSVHERSSAGMMFAALAGLSLVESVIAHVLIMRWSASAAWILTVLSVYGALWLAAIARSFALRPILVGRGQLTVRNGMLGSFCVPIDQLGIVRRGSGEDADWSALPLTCTTVELELSSPVVVAGMYGRKRQVKRIALSVDDVAAFEQALEQCRL
ncbi:MAG TPA: hypothetical protein VKU19_32780 [Bryobacteraceae bacterium]|nr:hypothetical protein [Bryobacteraceae bacterium]